MRAVIVGLGSIGKRHLANIELIESVSHVTICHQRPSQSADTPSKRYSSVDRLEDALKTNPDIALITGPASLHIETALSFARQGVHLFVEKPLSNDLRGVDELLETCHRRNLVLMVGYNLRFFRPLQVMRQALIEGRIGRPLMIQSEVGQYLPEWRPDTDYRQSVSARRDLGGGAVLELSHELDYARWLLGEVKSVSAQTDHVSDLDIDVEDVANIILQFNSGAQGSIHLDMIRRPATRTCRIDGAKGTLTWDGITHQTQLFSSQTNSWIDLHPATRIDPNDTYVAELRHFVECVGNNSSPLVGGEDGRRALQIALAAKQSSSEGRVIEL
jgi:predicted dehydrogenase